MWKLAVLPTAIGNVNFMFKCKNCCILCNSLQPEMIIMFNSQRYLNKLGLPCDAMVYTAVSFFLSFKFLFYIGEQLIYNVVFSSVQSLSRVL